MTPIETQIEQIDAMARQHYPEDPAGRNAYKVGLLETRLREFASMMVALPVRDGGKVIPFKGGERA